MRNKIVIMVIILLISSCGVGQKTNSFTEFNSQNLLADYYNCYVDRDDLYYTYPDPNGGINLICYNTKNMSKKCIDTGWYLGHVQVRNNNIYYIKYNDWHNGFIVKSDMNGAVKQNIELPSGQFLDGKDFHIYVDSRNNVFYFNANSAKLYDMNMRRTVIDNINRPYQCDDVLYYVDMQQNIHQYNMLTQTDDSILSSEQLISELHNESIIDRYIIRDLICTDTTLYFIYSSDIEYEGYHRGYLLRYNMADHTIQSVLDSKMCYKYKEYHGEIYAIAFFDKAYRFYQCSDNGTQEIRLNSIDISTVKEFFISDDNLYLFGICENSVDNQLIITHYFVITDLYGNERIRLEE